MKRLPCTTAGAVALSCLIGMAITMIGGARYDAPLGVPAASAGVQASEGNGGSPNPCAPPTSVTAPPHETAWRLWVAATCPVNQHQYPYVVWQNWIEQAQMYPPDPANGLKVPNALAEAHSATHQFHPSPLTLSTGEPPQLSDGNCTVAKDPPPDHPNLVICEEVRLNGATEDYIAGNSLWNRPGQQHMATTGGTIQFPPAAVSIKADWLRLDSCENPPQGVHVYAYRMNSLS